MDRKIDMNVILKAKVVPREVVDDCCVGDISEKFLDYEKCLFSRNCTECWRQTIKSITGKDFKVNYSTTSVEVIKFLIDCGSIGKHEEIGRCPLNLFETNSLGLPSDFECGDFGDCSDCCNRLYDFLEVKETVIEL